MSIASRGHANIRYLRRVKPPKMIATEPDTIAMMKTSLSAGLNIAFHLGVKRVYLVGADNSYGKDNRANCHTEHPWPKLRETWRVKTHELQLCAKPLEEAGIKVFNCSPASTIPIWPKVDLMEALK
jgi:hypothetical protein